MGDTPRFPPSQRKRDWARKSGRVAHSPALTSAAVLVAVATVAMVAAPRFVRALLALAQHAFAGEGSSVALLDEAWHAFAACAVPILVVALGVATAVGIVQTGALFTLWPLVPGGANRAASSERPRALRSLALLAVAAAATLLALSAERAQWALIVRAPSLTASSSSLQIEPLRVALRATLRVALHVGLAMVGVGLVDYLLLRARWERSLWMTRAEVERERRDEEGDPRLRAERRRRQRAPQIDERLPDDLLGAQLVVTWPFAAAALRIDGERVVVAALGEHFRATRIVELARRAHIPVRFDESLGAALRELPPSTLLGPESAARAREIFRAARR